MSVCQVIEKLRSLSLFDGNRAEMMQEICEYLGVSRDTVLAWMKSDMAADK